uniref:Uncharacterized protein n=1 Tax=Panagrellus redivivus TaxID=6233 RepID=A0A7E4W1W8_PANRE
MFTPNTIGAILTRFNLRSSEPALPGSLLSLRTSPCLVHPNIGPSMCPSDGFDFFDDEWTVDNAPKPLIAFDG